jgi:glucose-1-phosphate thymidylyltransferase
MIYYPLSILMMAGIRDIMIISTPRDLPLFQGLLGDGSKLGHQFHLCRAGQSERAWPRPIASARTSSATNRSTLILGDNLFYGAGLGRLLDAARKERSKTGASVFAYLVKDPDRYGVVEFDDGG